MHWVTWKVPPYLDVPLHPFFNMFLASKPPFGCVSAVNMFSMFVLQSSNSLSLSHRSDLLPSGPGKQDGGGYWRHCTL